MFSSTQRIVAQHLYTLLSSMTPEARSGAALALSTMTISTEDGYISLNGNEPRVDFFVQCYDIMLSAALSLKMLRDDGLITDYSNVKIKPEYHADAELAIARIETLLSRMAKATIEETH